MHPPNGITTMRALTALHDAVAEIERLRGAHETTAPPSYADLERRMYRMFEHGKTNNTVSAQCECQALRIAMGWTGAGASIPPEEPVGKLPSA
jgi:hypothetical protein